MSTIDVLFIVSACIFPLILMSFLLHSKEVKFTDSLRAIRTYNKFAINYSNQLFNRYKVVIFTPNIVGVIINTIATFSPEAVSITTIRIYIYHVALLIVSGIGLAMLKIAGTRLLIILLGETAANWALIGGIFILGYYIKVYIYNIYPQAAIASLIMLAIFLIVMLYFDITKSAKTYVGGVSQWKLSSRDK